MLKLPLLFSLSFPALQVGSVSAGRSRRKAFRGYGGHCASHREATGVPSTGLDRAAGGYWVDGNILLGNNPHLPRVRSPGFLSRSCFLESAEEGEQQWTRELNTPSLPRRCPPSCWPMSFAFLQSRQLQQAGRTTVTRQKHIVRVSAGSALSIWEESE